MDVNPIRIGCWRRVKKRKNQNFKKGINENLTAEQLYSQILASSENLAEILPELESLVTPTYFGELTVKWSLLQRGLGHK